MKKTLTLLLLASLTLPAIAQDAKVGPQQRKKFRMGLNVSPSVDWFQTTSEDLDLEAVRVKFGAGLIGEYAFGNNYALTFGLEYKGAGGALAYKNAYYYSKEDGNLPFQLETRNYRYDYINVPITMKLMTNEIGYFTYFAQVGVDLSVLVTAKALDKGKVLDTLAGLPPFTPKERDYTDVYGSSSFGQVRLRVGVGAEWNFSGNTSLVFSVTYHHGFIDVLRDADGDDIANEEGIFYSEPQNVFDANVKPTFVMSANQHFVALNVGVLF